MLPATPLQQTLFPQIATLLLLLLLLLLLAYHAHCLQQQHVSVAVP